MMEIPRRIVRLYIFSLESTRSILNVNCYQNFIPLLETNFLTLQRLWVVIAFVEKLKSLQMNNEIKLRSLTKKKTFKKFFELSRKVWFKRRNFVISFTVPGRLKWLINFFPFKLRQHVLWLSLHVFIAQQEVRDFIFCLRLARDENKNVSCNSVRLFLLRPKTSKVRIISRRFKTVTAKDRWRHSWNHKVHKSKSKSNVEDKGETDFGFERKRCQLEELSDYLQSLTSVQHVSRVLRTFQVPNPKSFILTSVSDLTIRLDSKACRCQLDLFRSTLLSISVGICVEIDRFFSTWWTKRNLKLFVRYEVCRQALVVHKRQFETLFN